MRLLSKIITVFIASLITVLVYVIRTNNIPVKTIGPKKEIPAKAKFVKISEVSRDKEKGFFLNAKSMDLLQNQADENLLCHTVSCTMISQNKEIAHIHSKETNFNPKTKDLFLKDKVTGDFSDMKLEGKNFTYSYAKQEIKTSEKSQINHPKFVITSDKSHFKFKNKTIEFFGNVESHFH